MYKKGEYFIGDPMFAFGEKWDDILEENDFFPSSHHIEVDGHKVFVTSIDGEGELHDNLTNSYDVESCYFAVIPVEALNYEGGMDVTSAKSRKEVNVLEFNNDFDISFDGFVMKIAGIVIKF